jgi:peptidoglycan/xylan/chitin deacetylase (PgdA/CDA1 family)
MLTTPILERISQCHLITGYYHLISDDPPIHVKHLYTCKTPSQFEHDIDFLLKRYNPMDISQLLAHIKYRELLRDRFLLLTFDDGFRESYDSIAPILLRKGVPAIFFINTAFIDNREMSYEHKKSIISEHLISVSPELESRVFDILRKKGFSSPLWLQSLRQLAYADRSVIDEIGAAMEIDFETYLRENRPYLTREQISNLLSYGFHVGSHSIDHPLYRDLPLDEQLRQTIESTRYVKSQFGLSYGCFAFPHTDEGVTSLFFDRLVKTQLVDIAFGTGGLLDDSVSIQIQRMSFERPLAPVEHLLRRQLLRRFYRQVRGSGVVFHPPG